MAFMGTFDASKDLAKVDTPYKFFVDTYDDLKGSRDQNIQECQDIGIGIGSEEIDEVVSGILGGILTKVVPGVVVDSEENLVKLGMEYLVGILDGIIKFFDGVNSVKALRGIIGAILGTVEAGDDGEIVVAKEDLVKLAMKYLDNPTKDIATGVAEFMVVKKAKKAKEAKEILEVEKVMVVEEDMNVKNTDIKYKLKLKFKSIEASSLSFQAVKNTNNDEVLDDFARSIREMQAARRVWDKKYRGTSANDFPQFHRQTFQQNFENLIQGEEDLDKIEQEFQEDAKFDLAKWTNECFGNSSARVPLYARGKDKY